MDNERFACQVVFSKIADEFNYQSALLISTSTLMENNGVDIERDVFGPIVVEDARAQMLADGVWKVFITGTAQLDNEDYVFEAIPEDVIFISLALKPELPRKGR